MSPIPSMTWPTIPEVREFLGIEVDLYESLLQGYLDRSKARIRNYLGRPIDAIDMVFDDQAVSNRLWQLGNLKQLIVPVTPFDVTENDLVIVDGDEEILDSGTFLVTDADLWRGIIRSAPGYRFGNGPYSITAKVGLATSLTPDFLTVIQPQLQNAVLDLCADYWHRRNPGVVQESAGGASQTFPAKLDMPARVCGLLDEFAMIRA